MSDWGRRSQLLSTWNCYLKCIQHINLDISRFLQSVIPGLMQWKQFPSHCLVAMDGEKKIASVWKPRRTNPFSTDLLPTMSMPELLPGPQHDDLVDLEKYIHVQCHVHLCNMNEAVWLGLIFWCIHVNCKALSNRR